MRIKHVFYATNSLAFHYYLIVVIDSMFAILHCHNILGSSISEIIKVICVCVHTAAVEACVLHALKRRAAGFLRSNKVAALFMKVGKNFTPAEELCKKAQELEQIIETK